MSTFISMWRVNAPVLAPQGKGRGNISKFVYYLIPKLNDKTKRALWCAVLSILLPSGKCLSPFPPPSIKILMLKQLLKVPITGISTHSVNRLVCMLLDAASHHNTTMIATNYWLIINSYGFFDLKVSDLAICLNWIKQAYIKLGWGVLLCSMISYWKSDWGRCGKDQ